MRKRTVRFFLLLLPFSEDLTTQKSMGENEARTLLLKAIEGSLQQPEPPQHTNELTGDVLQNVRATVTWWSHVRDRFLLWRVSDAPRAARRQKQLRIWSTQSPAFHFSAAVDANSFSHTKSTRRSCTRFSLSTQRCAHVPPPENQVPVGSQQKIN